MSIVNRTHQFIFVHVPKSAGTSVTQTLSRMTEIGDVEVGGTAFGEAVAEAYRTRFGLTKHSTAREIQAIVGETAWSSAFTFAFVRNPYRRAYSTYTFLKRRFRAWKGSERMDRFHTFDDFVASEMFQTQGPDRILRPQVFWLRTSDSDDAPCVDFVGHVEQIDHDMEQVLRQFDRDGSIEASDEGTIRKANSSDSDSEWQSAYANEQTRQLVSDRYQADFRRFGYPLDSWRTESAQQAARTL